jgi:DNA-binding NtrC family response regulator
MSQVVLIVDDDPVQRRLLENMVQRFGYRALVADGGDAAATLLCGPQAPQIDCVILDMVMPDLDGMGVLARMRAAGRNIPVIVQTAHGGIDNAVSAMRAGAVDFVVKPAGPERLQVSLRNALAADALAGELQRLKRSRDGTLTFTDVITRSAAMKNVLHAAGKAATSSIPALIEGESGVGKELIARAIHGSGERRAKPFVAVNCGALPENLVESILFGHEKGAFTGATEKHSGKFAEADGGTLFLDEVGELPLPAQVKLLRALQQNEIEPVGGKRPIRVDVRIVSATNRDLIADVKAGRFREDLFYRLHVFPLTVPPLRARSEDIPELARHFMARFAAEEGKRMRAIDADALALLAGYSWPGNVRQLENAVFRAVVLAEGETLGVNEFPHVQRAGTGDTASAMPMVHEEMPVAPRSAELTTAAASLPLTDVHDHVRTINEIERDVIRFAISHYRGQMSEVARRLQIGRSTLYRKLESLGLENEAHEPVN